MVAIILGIGVLGIPQALVKLGWALGLFLLFVSAAGAVYSGLLIARLVAHVTVTTGHRPHSYEDLGQAAFGHAGRLVRRSTCCLSRIAGA